MELEPGLTAFLLRAKRATYAAGSPEGVQRAASRPASHDLGYSEGAWSYLDTYLGGFAFAGEEAVWLAGRPLWSMNYYGTMTVAEIPAGFSPFLKAALLRVPADAPYRGPQAWQDGPFAYSCRWEGEPRHFRGDEQIWLAGRLIYTLDFHGGVIL